MSAETDADAVSTGLVSAAQGPKQVTVDGLTTVAQPLPDLIAADKYLRSKAAAGTGAARGLRFTRLIPSGQA